MAPLGRTAGYSGPRTGSRIEPVSEDDRAWLPDVVAGSAVPYPGRCSGSRYALLGRS
nr:hypothetical protein GCM10020092_018080 [Actinoplanes digitatis]